MNMGLDLKHKKHCTPLPDTEYTEGCPANLPSDGHHGPGPGSMDKHLQVIPVDPAVLPKAGYGTPDEAVQLR